MKRILFTIIILLLFSGIALGYELGAGDGTSYPAVIDTDTSVEVDYPDPLATTARSAVPNDTNAAVIAIETELGINPSGAYDTVRARLDAGDGLYYLKTEIDTKFAELKFTDLSDTPVNYTGQAGKYTKVNAGETALEFGTPDAGGASTYLELTDTPADYTGNSLKFVRVNVGETALEFAEEADPTVDTDAEIKAILVDEVIKTGAFTAGKIAKINNATGIIEEGTNTDTDVADAVIKKHSQNTDTDLDSTFEATFVKKADTVNVLSDITSSGAEIEDAVAKRHSKNADTALGTQTQDLNMGSHKIIGLVDPVNPQDAATKAYADTKVATEVDPTVDSDAKIKAILVDEVTKTGTLTVGNLTKTNNATGVIEDAGVATETTLTVDSDTKIPTSKAVYDFCETQNYMQSLHDDTAPVLGGDMWLWGYNITFGSYIPDDHKYSGLICSELVGESVAFGDLLYFNWTDKEWKKADADAAATMPGLRIALESKIDGETCNMLIMGYIRDDTWNFTGSIIYASATAGGVTSVAPSGAGQQLQRVGVAKSADILFFNPSIDVGEI